MRNEAPDEPVTCDDWTPGKGRCQSGAAFVVIRRSSVGQLTIKEFCPTHYLGDILADGGSDVKHGFISFATTPLFTDKL